MYERNIFQTFDAFFNEILYYKVPGKQNLMRIQILLYKEGNFKLLKIDNIPTSNRINNKHHRIMPGVGDIEQNHT